MIGDLHSRLTGDAWVAVGDVRRTRGDWAGARDAYDAALTQFEGALGANAPATVRARASVTALDEHAS